MLQKEQLNNYLAHKFLSEQKLNTSQIQEAFGAFARGEVADIGQYFIKKNWITPEELLQEAQANQTLISLPTEQPKIINNRYQILHKIGSGGMGEIYKGIDTQTQNFVAIKTSKLTKKTHQKRFIQEHKLLADITHPNLIKSYDFSMQENGIYIILEYVKGSSLRHIITKEPHSLSIVEQLAIANKVARGIEVLNTAEVIHRDIKPENIMINKESGVVKVLDLGIGKNVTDKKVNLTIDGEILGTLAYLSPEQASGSISLQSDIFSLGVTLYQFFSWQTSSPFEEENEYSTLMKIDSYHPPNLLSLLQKNIRSSQEKELYSKLSKVIAMAMEKKPQKRWQNAGQIADQFAKLQKQFLKIPYYSTTVRHAKLINLSSKIDPSLQRKLQEIRKEHLSKTGRSASRAKRQVKSSFSLYLILLAALVIVAGYILHTHLKQEKAKRLLKREKTKKLLAKKLLAKKLLTKKLLEAKEKAKKKNRAKGWPQKLWQVCWNKKQGWLDFTTKEWGSLVHKNQVEYATSYQKWYAQYKKLLLYKEFEVKKVKFKLVLIPPGKFWMGSPQREEARKSREKLHWVVINKAFYLGVTEVTQEQWYAVTGKKNWSNKPGVRENPKHAASYISLVDTKRDFLPHLPGDFGLPTEAQWEYACRAGTLTRYYWGDDLHYSEIGKYAWYTKNAMAVGNRYTHPVGKKLANGWGLYDMSGNLWEWCEDLCRIDRAKRDITTNTYINGLVNPVCTVGRMRIVRSGFWGNPDHFCRSAFRGYNWSHKQLSYIGTRLLSSIHE